MSKSVFAFASVLLLATLSVGAIQAGGHPPAPKDGKDAPKDGKQGKDGKPAQPSPPAQAPAPEPAANPGPGIEVVLTKRNDDGPYEKSAYSFRYMTQDVAIHKNEVDLVYGECGQLHVQPTSSIKSKIVKVPVASLDQVETWPNAGWKTSSIAATKNTVYVMEVDDGTTRMRIKFLVTTVNAAEVHLVWMPFRDMSAGLAGTLSKCVGKHAEK